jgi:hypothetical protein
MARIGTNDKHANLAVDLYRDLLESKGWGLEKSWLAIAQLLMTCQVWESGKWHPFHALPVLMERNNYKVTNTGKPNRSLLDAERVANFLASQLQISPPELCSNLGLFFEHPEIRGLQPNNPRGHAFRSIVAETISRFGDPGLTIIEEQSPHDLFPGFSMPARSDRAKIDIVVKRGPRVVALVSTRWTYRHDRVDLIDEAMAYMPAARSVNPTCVYYGVVAEFGKARLKKVIDQTEAVVPTAALRRLVHIKASLASDVIDRNGDLAHLIDLEEMVNDSRDWN